MSPLMMRIFTLVGLALAAASMQPKARADSLPQPAVPCVHAAAPAAGPGRVTF